MGPDGGRVTRREEAGNKVVRTEAEGRWAKQEIVCRTTHIVVAAMLFSLDAAESAGVHDRSLSNHR